MIGMLAPNLLGPAQLLQPAQSGGMLSAPAQQASQMPQQPGRFAGLREMMRPENMLPVASQLLGNNGNMANLGNAFAVAGQGMADRKQRNQTLDYLKQNDPELAQMVEATGMPLKDAWSIHQTRLKAQTPEKTSSMKEYEFARSQGYDGSFMDWQNSGSGTGGQTHGTPIYTQDEEGNIHVNFAPKSGTDLVPMGTGGQRVLGPYDTAEQRARGTAEGKGQGEAWDTYRSMTSKMPGLRKVVDELGDLGDKATYTIGGQMLDWGFKQIGAEPREAAVARAQYTAMVDNQILPLLRDTFGAQFTQQEGQALRETLGDPDKSPAEKRATLNAFIEQKERDIEALALRTGADGGGSLSPAGPPVADPLGIRR